MKNVLQRTLILNRWPQYASNERWDNCLARTEDLIPHDRHHVTYICDAVGRLGVPDTAHEVHLVRDFADTAAIHELVADLVRKGGAFQHLFAFSENLLDLAARLRASHAIPGPGPVEIERFRDKQTMKTFVQRAGVRVPRWFACRSLQSATESALILGFPLIVKPVRGTASQGVYKIRSFEQLQAVCAALPLDEYEIEEYIEGEVLHADGVVSRDGKCLFTSISRYVSSCLDFESGVPLGSIIQTDATVRERGQRFTEEVVRALDLRSSAFHLEFFDTGRDFVFLEIAARVPGADVAYVIHDVCGVNLFRLWVDVALGKDVDAPRAEFRESGGWLIIPRPKPLPQVVVQAESLLGKVPFLYRELIPKAGQTLEASSGYATFQGGRFLFRGGGPDEIAGAMRKVIGSYTLKTRPTRDAVCSPPL
jgi:hypothetical protein